MVARSDVSQGGTVVVFVSLFKEQETSCASVRTEGTTPRAPAPAVCLFCLKKKKKNLETSKDDRRVGHSPAPFPIAPPPPDKESRESWYEG